MQPSRYVEELSLNAHEHALWLEFFLLHNLTEVGPLFTQLEIGQAEGNLDDLVEVLEAADVRVEEDRLYRCLESCRSRVAQGVI